jgi:hypothetical protein
MLKDFIRGPLRFLYVGFTSFFIYFNRYVLDLDLFLQVIHGLTEL